MLRFLYNFNYLTKNIELYVLLNDNDNIVRFINICIDELNYILYYK